MRIGIVTTWFERGAAYVSKQFEQILKEEHDVFIYARGGEKYAIGNPIWDKENVTWGKNIRSRFALTLMHKKDFKSWIDTNAIELILFNEQHWFEPLLWCKEWKIKTAAYIDYYTKATVELFDVYDLLICNTKRHYSVFEKTKKAKYLAWGTDTDKFVNPGYGDLVSDDFVTFFHSCGMGPQRKGTEQLIQAFEKTKYAKKLIIHTQRKLIGGNLEKQISKLESEGRLEIVKETVAAPGLFHLGDVYLYPTLLEGIGLTIAEALSCGLPVIVPDNGPMNEFVEEGHNGLLVELGECYYRQDGYYWPMCKVNIDDLANKIDTLATNKKMVLQMKKNAREYATKNLSLLNNMKSLSALMETVEFKPLTSEISERITKFSSKGFGKFNKLYIRLYSVIGILYAIHGYIKPYIKK